MTTPEDDGTIVHPRWRAWVCENLARGTDADTLARALVDEGLPAARARACVDELVASPALDAARALWRRVQALEQIVRLRREHREPCLPGHDLIARKPLPPVPRFLAEHWLPGTPAVFTDLVTRWPAHGRWSADDLVARLGEVTVQACAGRSAHPDPDPEWAELRRELTVRDLFARIRAPGAGNDVYVIAKNAALCRPGLRPLLAEIDLPASHFGPALDPTRMGLWIGAAGTHTPLHHDGDDSMFCQVVGRKRFRLAPPESLPLLDRARGVYSWWDPRTDDDLAAGPERLIELVLQPGEALFIPAGWWHQVDALDLSISVSVLAFAWKSDSSWYRPGSLLRG